jgi:hypothetical protein
MKRRYSICAAGLLPVVLGVPSPAAAQDAGKRVQPPGVTQPGAVAPAVDRGERMMIGHALAMAIEGSSLQLAARQMASNEADRVDRSKSAADRVQQLQQDARQSFEDANKLLRSSYDAVRDQQDGSRARRLYDAASRYTKTLYTLIGDPLVVSEKAEKGQGGLSGSDIASIMLINHSIKEALDACSLRKSTRPQNASGGTTGILREHAKQMEEHATHCIEKVTGVAAPNADASAKNATSGQGSATVKTLAAQGRDLVQIINEDEQVGAAPARPRVNNPPGANAPR